ncbi:hypothetical protein, partial [Frankia sp. AvcI1]|uniref:hypothetical protein n=1 Tax=Frankia sp. AvcI1 TaxID=573496 RepID=UPI001F447DA1
GHDSITAVGWSWCDRNIKHRPTAAKQKDGGAATKGPHQCRRKARPKQPNNSADQAAEDNQASK